MSRAEPDSSRTHTHAHSQVRQSRLCFLGPGTPSTTGGISKSVVRTFAGKIPIFGVCLGMQSIYEEYGGKIVQAGEIVHGKTSEVLHEGKGCVVDVYALLFHAQACFLLPSTPKWVALYVRGGVSSCPSLSANCWEADSLTGVFGRNRTGLCDVLHWTREMMRRACGYACFCERGCTGKLLSRCVLMNQKQAPEKGKFNLSFSAVAGFVNPNRVALHQQKFSRSNVECTLNIKNSKIIFSTLVGFS